MALARRIALRTLQLVRYRGRLEYRQEARRRVVLQQMNVATRLHEDVLAVRVYPHQFMMHVDGSLLRRSTVALLCQCTGYMQHVREECFSWTRTVGWAVASGRWYDTPFAKLCDRHFTRVGYLGAPGGVEAACLGTGGLCAQNTNVKTAM